MNPPSPPSHSSYTTIVYIEASMNLPPLPLPLLLNDSLQWSQREPATPFPPLLPNHSLHWSQHRPAIPPSLPTQPQPPVKPAWKRHSHLPPLLHNLRPSEASMKTSSSRPPSPTQPQPTVKPAWTRHHPPSSPTQPQPTVKPAKTRCHPPSYLTSTYSEASKNSPSSPSLLNLSLQLIQQEPAIPLLPTQPQPTVKPARTRRPPPPYTTSAYSESSRNPPFPLPTQPQPTVNPARTRRPTQPQPTVKPARTRHPIRPQPTV